MDIVAKVASEQKVFNDGTKEIEYTEYSLFIKDPYRKDYTHKVRIYPNKSDKGLLEFLCSTYDAIKG